jgi:glucuronoarabinoxylan endo-1,4-beta-xylanase
MTRGAPLLIVLALLACSPEDSSPMVGSQTNWLKTCQSRDDCDGLECVCGVCTARCDDAAACERLEGASCIPADDMGAVALCGGEAPADDICLPRCQDGCAAGTSCLQGVCVPDAIAEAEGDAQVEPDAGPAPIITQDAGPAGPAVTVDTAMRFQALLGFGASLAYTEDPILAHPDREALYDLVFAEAGLDVLRLGNRYDPAAPDQTLPTPELVAAAAQRMGRTPPILMTSTTPPPALKANGSRGCIGEAATCTLVSLPGGGYDYAGFAAYWRQSLQAYADAGILPDYISIQNNPNWSPDSDDPPEACRFLPREGTATVTVDGVSFDAAYAGYREALDAVRAAIGDLPDVPRMAAPEANGVALGNEYLRALDAASFDAVAIHLYDVEDTTNVDLGAFDSVRTMAEQLQRPVFQTEMQAEGLDTAILIHHAFTSGAATAYLQNDLVALTTEVAPVSLVLLDADGIHPQGPYYALSHYAKSTDPDWVRVDAQSNADGLLSTAWIAPDDSALTVVLVNAGSEDIDVRLALDAELHAALSQSQVTRTVFDGDERLAMLGTLASDGMLSLPAGSIATVALRAE